MNHSPLRYHRAAMALHWVLAAMLAFQFALGLRLDFGARLAERFNLFQLHKSIGILILMLSVARLILRFVLPRPAPADGGVKGFAARLTHGLFYAVMIGAPLTGWAMVSLSKVKVPTVLFGIVPWPHLPLPRSMEGEQVFHAEIAWLLPVLIVLHLAGVAWHWWHKDGVLQRMALARLPEGALLPAGIGVLAGATLAGFVLSAPDWWRSISVNPAAPPAAASADIPAPMPRASSSADPVTTPSPEPSASESTAPQSADWRIDTGSRLGFATSYAGTPISGTFGSWTAAIRFDPAAPAQARIQASINLASARSGDDERDATLKGPGFFDIAAHPTATFVATGFQPLGRDRYAAQGSLSLNGISRPVRLVFNLKISGDTATAQGTAQLSRLAFRVGQDEWENTDQIPDGVSVNLSIRAHRVRK